MTYTMTYEPTPENIGLLIEGAQEVLPEMETVIRIAYEAGIKTSIARHLGPRDLAGVEILFRHPLSIGPTRRLLPESVLHYLLKLPQDRERFCPLLHEMDTCEFANAWRDLCKHVGIKLPLLSLVWPYEDNQKQKATIKWERTMSYLEQLATEWLKPVELEELHSNAKLWTSMGSKTGNRRRRLTRAQILAAHKTKASASAATTLCPKNAKVPIILNSNKQSNESDK
jgi:hypothetical protein